MTMAMDLSPRGIILLAVGLLFLSAIVPDAITELFSVNTTSWTPAAQKMWDLLPLIIVAGIVLLFVFKDRGEKSGG